MRTRSLTVAILSIVVALVPVAGADAAHAKHHRKRPTHGQCTVWASYKRPDLKISSVGKNWDNIARRKGFPVDGKPQVGDIAVWEANEHGAFSTGHVAYVTRVRKSGRFDVSEFNWGSSRERYDTRSNLSPAGLSFIHKKG